MDLLFFAAFLSAGVLLYVIGRLFENRLFVFAGAVLFLLLGMSTWTGLSYNQLMNYTNLDSITFEYSAVNVTTTEYNATTFIGNTTTTKYNLANSSDISVDFAFFSAQELAPHDLSVGLGLVFVLVGLATLLLLGIALFKGEGF